MFCVTRALKSPLKVQNGVQEVDSPIKKVAKRSRQILDSDDDEAPAVKERAASKDRGDKEAPGETEKVKKLSVMNQQVAFVQKQSRRGFYGVCLIIQHLHKANGTVGAPVGVSEPFVL